jgi:hypothetical protein
VEIVNKRHQIVAQEEAMTMLQIFARTFMTATRIELPAEPGYRRDPQRPVPPVRARWAGKPGDHSD